MKLKLWASVLVAMVTAVAALADNDAVARKEISDIRNGADNANQIRKLRVLGDAVIGGSVSPVGSLTNAWEQVFRAGTCTNGETVSFSPVFQFVPSVAGTYLGTVATNAFGALPGLTAVVTSNSVVFTSTAGVTNAISWMAGRLP